MSENNFKDKIRNKSAAQQFMQQYDATETEKEIEEEEKNENQSEFDQVVSSVKEKKESKPLFLHFSKDVVDVLEDLSTGKKKGSNKSKVANAALREFFKEKGYL